MAEYIVTSEEGLSVVIETAPITVFEVDGALRGVEGKAATIAVGTVTTVAPADLASVTNVGTANAAVFDFDIPQGEKGDTGPANSWGNITGTLSDQTDLQTALNAKYNASNPSGYTSNTGTVTSVSMTLPTGLQVTGSPITSAGTLAVSLSSGYVIPTTSALAAKLENITGLVSAGTNVTITGSGTSGSPYVISSSGGGGGSSTWGSITGTLSDQTDLQDALNLKLDATAFVPAGSNGQIQFNDLGAFGGFGSYDPVLGNLALGVSNKVATLSLPTDRLFEGGYINTPYISSGQMLNYLVRSSEFNNASWVKTLISTFSANTAVAPDGQTTAELVPAGSGPTANLSQVVTESTTGDWDFSVYLGTQSGTASFTIKIETDGGQSATKTITLTTDWKRYDVTANFSAAHTTKTVTITSGTTAFKAWGAQLDSSSYARPYLETAGAALLGYSGNTIFSSPVRMFGGLAITGSITVTSGNVSAGAGNFTNLITVTSSGIAATPTDRLVLTNPTSSTVGTPVQMSPRLRFTGNAWDTGAAAFRVSDWTIQTTTVSGNPASSRLSFSNQYNAAGYNEYFSLFSDGSAAHRSTVSTNASGLYIPWITGDTQPALYVGSASSTVVGGRFFSGSGNGVQSTSTSGIGVYGISSSSTGGRFSSSSSFGSIVESVTGTPLLVRAEDTTTTSTVTVAALFRHTTTQTPLAGFGTSIAFEGSSDSSIRSMGTITTEWSDPADATRTSRMILRPVLNGSTVNSLYLLGSGQSGFGVTSPTARVHLASGTATAGTAPLKLTAGTSLSTTEAGAIEYDGTHLYFTATNAGTRYQLDQQPAGTVTSVSVVSANGFAGSVATNTTTPAITISTSITGLLKGNGTAISAATAGTDYLTPGATQTVTATRVTPRLGTVASSTTPTINTDNVDIFTITALAANITSMTTNLSGTPTVGQKLLIRFKDDGTSRTIAHGASFIASGVATPLAATVIGKTHHELFVWDGSSWVCMAADPVGY